MKTSAIWAVAALLAATVGVHGSCSAGEKGRAGGRGASSARSPEPQCPTAQLGREHARGAKNHQCRYQYQTFDGSLSDGALRGNAVVGNSATGTITTSNSINNNTGITTVFQNSGNNSLFQQSTSINITVHCVNRGGVFGASRARHDSRSSEASLGCSGALLRDGGGCPPSRPEPGRLFLNGVGLGGGAAR